MGGNNTATKRIRKANMLKALEQSMGIVTTAAKMVGLDRDVHYKWMREDQKYKEAVQSLEGAALDFAESKLLKQIEGGDTTAIIFYLKTKGKGRGYVERQELVGGMSITWTEEKTYEADGQANQGAGLPGG
jgi:hypothetical protein